MHSRYVAKSLDDIAEHFNERADVLIAKSTNMLVSQKTKKAIIIAEAGAWREAAAIIRNTEIDMTLSEDKTS
jgi:phosphohistidine swiveling domain-containing protein